MNSLIVGTWKLKSFEVHLKNGEVTYPFGEDATGLIVYTDTGFFSVQYMPKEQGSGDLRGISYFGKFEYNREKDYVIHHMEGTLFPNTEGFDKLRYAQVRGKKLKLTCPPVCWDDGGATSVFIEFEKQEEIPQLAVTQPQAAY